MEIQTPFLIEAEAAEFLRLRPQTLSNWRSLGIGPRYSKIGGRVVYSREALTAFAQEKERTSTTTPTEAA